MSTVNEKLVQVRTFLLTVAAMLSVCGCGKDRLADDQLSGMESVRRTV